jgi:hypothetical protein
VRRVNNLEKHYFWNNEQIFYKKSLDDVKSLIVPKLDERNHIIASVHCLGHFQLESTMDRLKVEYFWKNMEGDVISYIARCMTCQRNQKVPALYHKAHAIEVEGVFDKIGIDLVFGLPVTKEGYLGVLCIIERLTKYPCVYPIKSKNMSEMAECLLHYFSMWGISKEILSNQGLEFNNRLVAKLLKATGVEHKVTSSYSPRTNGVTERWNSVVVNSLRKHTEQNQKEWNLWIPFVLMAYRSRIHSVTGFSPFELLFGRKMITWGNWS